MAESDLLERELADVLSRQKEGEAGHFKRVRVQGFSMGGAYALAAGIVLFFVLPVLLGGMDYLPWNDPASSASSTDSLPLIARIIALGFALFGVGALLASLGILAFTPERTRTCPYCDRQTTLMRKVRSYVCPGCGHLLRMSPKVPEDATEPLVKTACDVCGTEWATTPGSGTQVCHGCGSHTAAISGLSADQACDARCEKCGAGAWSTAAVCGACGSLLAEPYLGATPVLPVSLSGASTMGEAASTDGVPEGLRPEATRMKSGAALVVQATWLGERCRRDLGEEWPPTCDLSFDDLCAQLSQFQRPMSCLAHGLARDPGLAGPISELLAEFDVLLEQILRRGIDVDTGSVGRGGRSTSVPVDLAGRLTNPASKIPDGIDELKNRLRAAGVAKVATFAWPSPLFSITVTSATFFNSRGGSDLRASFVVDAWGSEQLRKLLMSKPAEGNKAWAHFTVPPAVLASRKDVV